MTERLVPDTHEFALPQPEQHKALPTPEQAQPLQAGEKDPVQALQAAHERVAAEQDRSHDATREHLEAILENQDQGQPAASYIDTSLKKLTFWRELKHIQHDLPAPQRLLSSVIHQPVIRAVSEGTAKTAARPSGLLGGGLLAFIGTSGYLYLARHMGFPYNSGVFLAFFCGGFLLGIVIEFLVHAVTRHPRS